MNKIANLMFSVSVAVLTGCAVAITIAAIHKASKDFCGVNK